MVGDTFVVRNTFLEVFDQQTDEVEVKRQHSAPPSLEVYRKDDCSSDPFDAPRLPSTPAVLYDRPKKDPPKWTPSREAWEPPSAQEHEEWLSNRINLQENAEGDADALEEGLEGRDITTMTTVILRNVPHTYTRNDLLELLDSEGFSGRYDFLYLPVKFGSSCAFGYAMINLVEHEDARRFQAHFQNFSDWKVPYGNKASVSWSKAHQGLAEHIERYRNSPMMHPSMPDDCKPIVLENGIRVMFPPPTKKATPQRRSDRNRNSKKKEGSRGGPGSVSSLASDVSAGSDLWKAPGSVSSAASTPAGTAGQLAEPTASPLFQGLTWLEGEQHHQNPRSETGLYQLTTQMIVGSDCSSEQSLRSSAPSQLTSSCRSAAPSTCSSKGRRGYGTSKDGSKQKQSVTWSNTILAAGLEAAPETTDARGNAPQEDKQRHAKKQGWWPFASNGPAAGNPAPYTHSSRDQQTSSAAPLLPGAIVELVGGHGASGQQGRILVVDHAREQYKVQLCDGNIRMVKSKNVRFVR